VSSPGKGLSEFVAEATEILDALSRDLLTLDERRGQEADPDLVNGIFRAAHSLKGLAGMFGQDRIATLAHASEDLLDRLRLGKVELSDPVLDAMVESLDVFQALLSECARGEATPLVAERAKELAARLPALAAPQAAVVADLLDGLNLDPQVRAVFTEYEEHRLRENLRKGVGLWRVRAGFDLSDFDQGLARLNGQLKPLGEVISTLPSAEPGDGSGIAFDLIVGSRSARHELEEAIAGLPASLAPLAGEAPDAAAPVKAKKAAGRRSRKAGAERGGGQAPALQVDEPGRAESGTQPGELGRARLGASPQPGEPGRPAPSVAPQPGELARAGLGASPQPGESGRAAPSVAPQPGESGRVALGSAPQPGNARRAGARPPPPIEAEPPLDSLADADELPAVAQLPTSATARPKQEFDTSLRSLTQTVRVDIQKLDSLMNAVGELLLVKANLQRLAESARQEGVHPVSKLFGQELHRESRSLERKLDELQKGILEVRMVPLGQVFDKLARLVRRIAREGRKEIDFAIDGGEVELDKLIVEELSDPLMHLIRNAIDHGIEPADDRAAANKARRGLVSLLAAQKGNHVVITVSDDGAGLDEERIREVAVHKGLITEAQANEMSRRELQNLIFLPGFSTAKAVSELSGRGVGLDVVKTNLAHMSGIIDIESERGRGTSLTLTLPVTLAIIRALVVAVSGRTYAVPLNSVLEIISLDAADVRTVERREVVSLRGQTLPIVRLARLFGLPERTLKRHFVVVVGLAQNRLGIAVDELLGQQDIVTKPLGGRLRQIPGISGATDLGNRLTVLVLDVGALMEEVISPERRVEFL
jgi:two-component system chemotaxis sensor kinase CheA